MKKWLISSLISINIIFLPLLSLANTFTCPILMPNELYFSMQWVSSDGQKLGHGAWNGDKWRLWVNGDSYLTPQNLPVVTTPLVAHYFAETHSWYLKCTSADLNIGPRNNVWPYDSCNITSTGFECQSSSKAPLINSTPITDSL